MKKTMIVLSAVLALVACNKVAPEITDEGTIDASKVVFNITVNHPEDTKAVKTGWTSGDVVYAFFEGNTTQYVKMTFNGTSWTYRDKNGGTTFSGLTLAASGKKVTAVYLPFNTDTPTYSSGWSFPTTWYAYYMKAEGVDYTVTTDPSTDISTLSAVLNMTTPAGFVQFLLPEASPVVGKYALYQGSVTPAACGKITPGGAVAQVTKTTGYPMDAMTVSGEGYYFYGTIAASVANPKFFLVESNPTYGFAIGTQSKSFSGTLTAGSAIKFTSAFGTQEPWVDLGLTSGLKWATGNLSNSGIVAPTAYGQYYAWGETTGYDYDTTHKFDGSEYEFNADPGTTHPDDFTKYNSSGATLEAVDDAAYVITSGVYRMPTTLQIQALHTACGDGAWITASGVNGRKFTGPNGLQVFFPAAGVIKSSGARDRGDEGHYWSSSQLEDESEYAYYLYFDEDNVVSDDDYYRCYGFPIRPVKN